MSESRSQARLKEELLPCPFCGGTAELNKHFKHEIWSLIHRCPAVGAISFEFGDREYHIKNWNARHQANAVSGSP